DFNTPMLTASEQLTAQQTIHGNGGMAIQGGDGATFTGNVKQTGGDYETDGNVITPVADMNTHRHPNGHDGQPTGTPMK
ncbi:phage baseplate assembly protein V, partial [Salmonella enterica]